MYDHKKLLRVSFPAEEEANAQNGTAEDIVTEKLKIVFFIIGFRDHVVSTSFPVTREHKLRHSERKIKSFRSA